MDSHRFHQGDRQEKQNALEERGTGDHAVRNAEHPGERAVPEAIAGGAKVSVLVLEQQPRAGFAASLLAGPEGWRGGHVSEISQDMACAEIGAEPYLRCHPQPRGGLPADRGGRQALIRRELADRHGQFLVVHLKPGVKAGARPQQSEGEVVKLVRIGDDNGMGIIMRGTSSRLPAVDRKEP